MLTIFAIMFFILLSACIIGFIIGMSSESTIFDRKKISEKESEDDDYNCND